MIQFLARKVCSLQAACSWVCEYKLFSSTFAGNRSGPLSASRVSSAKRSGRNDGSTRVRQTPRQAPSKHSADKTASGCALTRLREPWCSKSPSHTEKLQVCLRREVDRLTRRLVVTQRDKQILSCFEPRPSSKTTSGVLFRHQV